MAVLKLAAAVALALALTGGVAHATPQEDDKDWSCVTQGNRVCGPDGDNFGHTPGCYDDTGRMVAAWPCHVVVNRDGSADVYTNASV